MIRLLAGLGLAAPAALALFVLLAPDAVGVRANTDLRILVTAVATGIVTVWLTALAVLGYIRFRFARLISAAERIAAGERSVEIQGATHGLEGRLARALRQASTAIDASNEAASVDRLTGVASRQALLTTLFGEVERATRYGRALSVAFVDIDHFKTVNDTYGHGAGDLVLREVAQSIKTNLRATDLVGRYGGEEFMLVLTETNVEDGAVLAEKLRNLVAKLTFSVEGNSSLSVTVSIGIAGGAGQKLRVDELIRDADAAMYSAKALGRNQTYIFAEPDEDARVPRAPISSAGRARAVEVGRAARVAASDALTAVISPLSHYRGQPSALIATIVTTLARQLDLPDGEVERIRLAALLHDVGKVAVPEAILEKPGSLTSAEWRSVVQHPRIGQVILEQATALKDAVPIILHHHERFSGHGYPYGLRGSDIPLGARIVAIADAYDAMVHDRPYKQAISHDRAVEELRRHAGSQFDPDLVRLFCDLYAGQAPEPDEAVLAMNAPLIAHEVAARVPQPLVAASAGPTGSPEPIRRRRGARQPAGEPAGGPAGGSALG